MIRIHNSLTGRKEELATITPGLVRMYVCGITVYDYIHIGHARMLIVFDMVHRHLMSRGLEVRLVQNITDIDDKIIRRAAENREPMEALTARFIQAMNEDKARLGILPPSAEPRATEYLPQIVALIARLVERGYAYQAGNGDVMYSVAKFERYGCLSGKCLADLRAGARVDVVEAKRDPLDFVLWKRAKAGEPSWDSPWGAGRPGWHIECSAMAVAELGGHFDIHGGGLDLKFPHHENEIAQSCAATGERFANLWMHNGFVNVDDEKMSKSLGNFFTVREVLPRLRSPEVMRYFMLACHYRAPIDYSFEQLALADAALERLYTALRELPDVERVEPGVHTHRFNEAMDDDFNTPAAIAVLHTLARAVNTARDEGDPWRAAVLGAELRTLAGTLGMLQSDPQEWFGSASHGEIAAAEVEDHIVARRAARAAGDWQEADRIRGRLADAGVILEDRPGGATVWRRAWRAEEVGVA